jgi:hypothetical protein
MVGVNDCCGTDEQIVFCDERIEESEEVLEAAAPVDDIVVI